MAEGTRPFDAARYLNSVPEIIEYLRAVADDPDLRVLLFALDNAKRALRRLMAAEG